VKGTIDQVEVFFSSISSLWARVLSFFVATWLGFVVAGLTTAFSWAPGNEFTFNFPFKDWYYVPVEWMGATISVCVEWWGLPHLLFLVAVCFAICVLDSDLFLTASVLFLFESWFWWWVWVWNESLYYYDWTAWHPLFLILPVMTFLVVNRQVRIWLRNRVWE